VIGAGAGQAQEPGYPVVVFDEQALDSVPRLIAWPDRDAIPGLDTGEGVVELQFVVDTLGRIEPVTLEILAVRDSSVLEPAAAFLAGCRFRPGQLEAGRPVRALIRRHLAVAESSILLLGPRDTTVVRW
jgi:hypothetical protein